MLVNKLHIHTMCSVKKNLNFVGSRVILHGIVSNKPTIVCEALKIKNIFYKKKFNLYGFSTNFRNGSTFNIMLW